MAEQKVDDREVKKIRESMRRDGAAKTAQRFGENSPEYRAAQQQRSALRSAGNDQRRLNTEHTTKESTMSTNTDKQTPAAQQRSAQAQRTAAQQKVAAMKQRQAQQAVRTREQNAKAQGQGQGM